MFRLCPLWGRGRRTLPRELGSARLGPGARRAARTQPGRAGPGQAGQPHLTPAQNGVPREPRGALSWAAWGNGGREAWFGVRRVRCNALMCSRGFAGRGRGDYPRTHKRAGWKKPSGVFHSPWALSYDVTAGPCSRHGAHVAKAQPAWIAFSTPTTDGHCCRLSGIYCFRGSEVTGDPRRAIGAVTQVMWGGRACGSPTHRVMAGVNLPSCNLQPSPPAFNSLYRDLRHALE